MVGILGYGVYIPPYRIKREEICKAWKRNRSIGENSVCGRDDDSLTMGVEAARHALIDANVDVSNVDKLILTTNSPPLRNKNLVPTIVEVLDARKDVEVLQIENGGGVKALIEAWNYVVKERCNVLIIASDTLIGKPGSEDELYAGAGAFAVLVGEGSPIAKIHNVYSYSSDILCAWREETSLFLNNLEDPRYQQFVVVNAIREALESFKKQGLKIDNFSKFVFNQKTPGDFNILTKAGLPKDKFVSVFNELGDSGTPSSLLSLSYVMEGDINKQDRIFVLEINRGLVINALDVEIVNKKGKKPLRNAIKTKKYVDYPTYLRYKGILEKAEKVAEADKYIRSLTREKVSKYGFKGAMCKKCGSLNFPIFRIGAENKLTCRVCQNNSEFEYKPISREGEVYSYTIVYYPPPEFEREAPYIVAVVELKDGIRINSRLTDVKPEEVKIGMPVEATFRRLMIRDGGILEYGYKFRPVGEKK